MYKRQHVVRVELLERGVESRLRGVESLVLVGELGGDEQVLARDVRGLHGAAHAAFVLVAGRGVDVPVAGVDRLADDIGRDIVLDLPDAVAELGDGPAVVEGQCETAVMGGASSVCVCRPSL